MKIEIDFECVFDEAQRMSEQIGQKAGAWDHHRIADEDKEQLLWWYRDGIGIVNVLLDRVLRGYVRIDTMTGQTEMELSIENSSKGLIGDVVRRLLSTHMITSWLGVVAPDLVPLYQSQEKGIEQELLRIAYYREMPY